jgi:hypothetical protein
VTAPRLLAFGALAALLAGCGPDHAAQERAARTLVYEKLSQPDLPVVVGPAVLQEDFAVVDWTRGAFGGGRTLLRRDKAGWTMVLCGGAPLKSRPALERAGVPDGTAGVLVTKLRAEEARISGARLEQIERWAGLAGQGGCPEARPG